MGEIIFPITPSVAGMLIANARPAKFGLGEKTVYNPEIRNNWEIPGRRIKIDGRSWNRTLDPALKDIQNRLGMPAESRLSAQLHNMVIYGPGQFFAGHQDSEKTDGMVATLVVLLPSEFRGGTLVVKHGDETKSFRKPGGGDRLGLFSFYSDCVHSVKEVTSGFRIALVYNLILEGQAELDTTRTDAQLNRYIKKYFASTHLPDLPSYREGEPRWLVYLLDHEYTQKSLGWQALKRSDRNAAALLLGAADELGLDAYLAIADVHEVWTVEPELDFGRGYGSYYGHNYSEPVALDSDSLTTGELVDDDIKLVHWLNRKGKKTPFESYRVHPSMVCWTKAHDAFDPSRSEYEGYMGNYGNTLDRWYNRAAVILWQKDQAYASMFVINARDTVKKIARLAGRNQAKGRAALETILPRWSKLRIAEPAMLKDVLSLACALRDEEISNELLGDFRLTALGKQVRDGLLQLMALHGEEWLIGILEKWSRTERDATFIKDLAFLIEGFLEERMTGVISWMMNYQFSTLVKVDTETYIPSRGTNVRCLAVQHFLEASWAARDRKMYTGTIDYVVNHPVLYPPEVLADLALATSRFPAPEEWRAVRFLAEAHSGLKAVIAKERAPGDWCMEDPVPCKCADCKELGRFLIGPDQENIWPLAKPRRRHIHGIIEDMGIPLTHNTRRTGSPHKLILGKTDALFKKEHIRRNLAVEKLNAIDALITG